MQKARAYATQVLLALGRSEYFDAHLHMHYLLRMEQSGVQDYLAPWHSHPRHFTATTFVFCRTTAAPRACRGGPGVAGDEVNELYKMTDDDVVPWNCLRGGRILLISDMQRLLRVAPETPRTFTCRS